MKLFTMKQLTDERIVVTRVPLDARVVYIAAPYSVGNTHANISKVITAAETLVAAKIIPVVPHLHHMWDMISPKPREYWLAIVTTIMLRCDAVLRLPGSCPGCDLEVELARAHNIPVYTDILELLHDKKRVHELVESDRGSATAQRDEKDGPSGGREEPWAGEANESDALRDSISPVRSA